MASLYIHIPFCRKQCSYCDFHFSTVLKLQSQLVEAICEEIILQKNFLPSNKLETIYFGGGTPSILKIEELKMIFKTIENHFDCSALKEVTLEANPDDLSDDYIHALRTLPIDRLSIGIQSFYDDELTYMNRTHNSKEALKVIEIAKLAGFKKFTIDLMYGIPISNNKRWLKNIEIFLALGVNHLSAYALTVEPKTVLANQIKRNLSPAVDEDKQAEQYDILIDKITKSGFINYEFSNFGRDGEWAIHNTNYWKGKPYLGIGPSAHSFDGENRYWNVSNNTKYIKALEQGILASQTENLSEEERYNEYLLTSLRTIWGADIQYIKKEFPNMYSHFLIEKKKLISSSKIVETNGILKINQKYKFLTDGITAELFYI